MVGCVSVFLQEKWKVNGVLYSGSIVVLHILFFPLPAFGINSFEPKSLKKVAQEARTSYGQDDQWRSPFFMHKVEPVEIPKDQS